MEHVIRVVVKEAFMKTTGMNPGKLVISKILDFVDHHRKYYTDWIVNMINMISDSRIQTYWDAPIYYVGLWCDGEDLQYEWYLSKIYSIDYKHYVNIYASTIRQMKIAARGDSYFRGYSLPKMYANSQTSMDAGAEFHPTRNFKFYLISIQSRVRNRYPEAEVDLGQLYDL